jgi:enamine deaminase RidA (YjgF/YER057c/UK114 family)
MDVSRDDSGQWHFRLGPVERVIIGASFALLVFLLGWVFRNFDSRLEAQGKTMQDVVTAQAVTNAQLQTLSGQLADVPGLTRQMAELKVQTERNSQDIHELQQVRRLK